MRTLTLDQFNREGISSPIENLKSSIAKQAELNAIYPCSVIINEHTYNKGAHDEYLAYSAECILDGTDIRVSDFDARFSFYDNRLKRFANISQQRVREIQGKFERPNYVKVATKTKVQKWVDYFNDVVAAVKIESEKNTAEIDVFLKSLEGLPVKWWNDKKSGWIEQNGIYFEFTIVEGYISKKMELRVYRNTIENFKALSANKYIQS